MGKTLRAIRNEHFARFGDQINNQILKIIKITNFL